jgi:hypothetical protein
MNYHFNIDEWLPKFPLKPKNDSFYCGVITSPCQICEIEQLRREVSDRFDWGPAVPMDVFVMGEGEPQDRHVTKVGGVPYRPSNLAWPTESDGSPLTFLAQFDFTDSTDITGKLPGEVLLVFTSDNGSEGPVESLYYEWHPLGMTDLISPSDVSEPKWRFDACYGYRYRTASYPKARRMPKSKEAGELKYRGAWIISHFWLLQYQAVQIGQAPYFIQQGDCDLPGRMLCTISCIYPDSNKPFPWVNHPEPLMPEGEYYDGNCLEMGDTGCIYISIDDAGRLHSNQSCF